MKIQRVISAIIIAVASLTFVTADCYAQEYNRLSQRGNIRQINQGGLVPIDSAALKREQQLAIARRDSAYIHILDSLGALSDPRYRSYATATKDSVRKVVAARLHRDSSILSKGDSIAPDGRRIRINKKGEERKPLISDSMSITRMCWLSLPLPGFGQIYNKQYWKLGILYPAVAGTTTLFALEHKKYKPLKAEYDQYLIDHGYMRTPELDALQSKMIRHNTMQQVYAGLAIATYIYFIGDAAINYSTNEVSSIKKATTLSAICPGAGQIYNKSYWRVPIVIGGMASTIYTVDWNNRGYQRFKTAYALRVDYEKEPTKYPQGSPDEFRGAYSDSSRRNRDMCILLTVGVYILQIIDAHVDAHLKDFDISDDLAMNLEPYFGTTTVMSKPTFGVNLSVNF